MRPQHVAHQIYRLEKIVGLRMAVLAVTGVILDAAKEQFCSTAQRLGCFYSILEARDLSRLLVAHGFLCPRDGSRISAGRCRCGYSPSRRILNVFQNESLRELATAHELGQAAGLIVLPPGSGKTRIAAADSHRFGAKSVLYVAHTHEILDVAESELAAVFGASEVTRHTRASTLTKPARANLITIQLLRYHLKVLKPDTFDYLVLDEFHHAAAQSYRKILAKLSPRFLLGLTATPFRGDRQDIVRLCDNNVLVNFELRSGIEAGVLTPYHYYGCFDNVDYSRIRHNGVRYDIRDLEKALVVNERDSAIIKQWKQHADGKATIAFCCSHRHAERFAASLNEQGVVAAVYLSSTSWEARAKLIAEHQKGDITVLCVVDILNEGADFPYLECLLFLRPTESKRIFLQQLGRGLRRYVGKSHCVVIDFIGNFQNAFRLPEFHGLQPLENDEPPTSLEQFQTVKELFNLAVGCEVHFDAKVIDVFATQVLDPRHATRHNIGRILLFQYAKLARRLGHLPTRADVKHNLLLDDRLYAQVFGSWRDFERLLPSEAETNSWPWTEAI